jgi:hypothetical protein
MIATILPSSTTFHAVDYNERKVSEGVAELLEMKNFGFIGQVDSYMPDQLKQYLTKYTYRNNQRIKSPQFHLAISCRGDEYSYEQLLDIAHQYLKEMGYGEDGQPVLIYAHHDTDNHHLHIVTSRVAPNGHKIDDHHERVHSQEVINRIMGENQQHRASEAVKNAFDYKFATLNQFRAILESSGYECYEKYGNLCIKRDGHVIDTLPLTTIQQHLQTFEPEERRRKQLRAILLKYRDMTADKEELRQLMKQKFGVDLVFHGSKDKPYGYTIIDHQSKTVLKGGDILKLKDLLQFQSKTERLHRMDEFIDAMLEDNPDLTTRELNRMLRRQFGTHISKGRIAYGDDFIDLKDYQLQALKANDLKAWMNAHPELDHKSSVSHGHNTEPSRQQQSDSRHLRKPTISKEGSRDQNREWEVGHNTRYNDIDDEQQLKR